MRVNGLLSGLGAIGALISVTLMPMARGDYRERAYASEVVRFDAVRVGMRGFGRLGQAFAAAVIDGRQGKGDRHLYIYDPALLPGTSLESKFIGLRASAEKYEGLTKMYNVSSSAIDDECDIIFIDLDTGSEEDNIRIMKELASNLKYTVTSTYRPAPPVVVVTNPIARTWPAFYENYFREATYTIVDKLDTLRGAAYARYNIDNRSGADPVADKIELRRATIADKPKVINPPSSLSAEDIQAIEEAATRSDKTGWAAGEAMYAVLEMLAPYVPLRLVRYTP